MAQEMAERLSAEQLRRLARVSEKDGKTLAEMNATDYLAAARRVGDAEVVLVTGAAAAYCGAL
jgi:NaMN:DMB phosphoribosyltransferase